jgi:ribose transport system ATP-binding protein
VEIGDGGRSSPAIPGHATALEVHGISKTFVKGQPVLDSLDLRVGAGEIHGLLGQNGSGKSTFVKILSGYHSPDHGGRLFVAGEEVHFPMTPRKRRESGLSFVQQDLGLLDELSIQDNVRVGRYTRGIFRNVRVNVDRVATIELLADFGLEYDPSTPVGKLSAAEKVILGIARAVDQVNDSDTGVIVLDEPTAALGREGVRRIFTALHVAAKKGLGVLFISHRIDEIFDLTDRITVLRDGRVVGRVQTSEALQDDLVEMIVGDRISTLYPSRDTALGNKPPRVQVTDLVFETLSGVTFEGYPGEILGLTGLQGSGFADVPIALSASPDLVKGKLSIDGNSLDLAAAGIAERSKIGLAVVPADRKESGAAQELRVRENVSLPRISDFFRKGMLRYHYESIDTQAVLEEFLVVPLNGEALMSSLSGGNQQKSVLAKWVKTSPLVLVLAEPTQGVDIGARHDIFRLLRSLADQGMTLLIASNEYEDLANLCDRVLVFVNGEVKTELVGDDLKEELILRSSYG